MIPVCTGLYGIANTIQAPILTAFLFRVLYKSAVFFSLPQGVVEKNACRDAIYFEQRSVAEVARQKHKTRQAINQTKIKALQKIKEAWDKDKNTAI